MNSSVYAIVYASLTRLSSMSVRILPTMLKVELHNVELAGKMQISTNTTQVCKTLCLKLGKVSKGRAYTTQSHT